MTQIPFQSLAGNTPSPESGDGQMCLHGSAVPDSRDSFLFCSMDSLCLTHKADGFQSLSGSMASLTHPHFTLMLLGICRCCSTPRQLQQRLCVY
eukprot:1146920-Pelagomonas_calceolata.AAC.2